MRLAVSVRGLRPMLEGPRITTAGVLGDLTSAALDTAAVRDAISFGVIAPSSIE